MDADRLQRVPRPKAASDLVGRDNIILVGWVGSIRIVYFASGREEDQQEDL